MDSHNPPTEPASNSSGESDVELVDAMQIKPFSIRLQNLHNQAFQAGDVVSAVMRFSHLQDLVFVARVNRFCSSYALQRLWKILPSGLHLLEITQSVDFVDGRWRLVRPLSTLALRRYEKYSQYIQKIVCPFSTVPDGDIDVDPAAFIAISALLPSAKALPALLDLSLPESLVLDIRHVPDLVHFFSSNLQQVELYLTMGGGMAISHLAAAVPTLKELSLSGFVHTGVIRQLFRFKSLVKISLHFSTHSNTPSRKARKALRHGLLELFESLPQLPAMGTFNFNIIANLVAPYSLFPETSFLVHIRKIHLRGAGPNLNNLLRITHNLEEVVLEFTSHTLREEDFCNSFEILSHHATLRSVKITSNTSVPLSSAFTPLLRIFGLHTLDIGTSISSSEITNADISNMVSAWPRLQRLFLPTEAGNGRPNVTLQCLIPLSTLSELKELRVRLPVGIVNIPLHYGDEANYLQSIFLPRQLWPHLVAHRNGVTNRHA